MPSYLNHLRTLNNQDLFRELHRKMWVAELGILRSSAFQICMSDVTEDCSVWCMDDIELDGDLIFVGGTARQLVRFSASERDVPEPKEIYGRAVAVIDDDGNVNFEGIQAKVQTE